MSNLLKCVGLIQLNLKTKYPLILSHFLNQGTNLNQSTSIFPGVIAG